MLIANTILSYRAEYFARFNLGHDVPFVNYTNSIVFYDQISNASRGATRPTWELLYSHYVQIKGLDAPWTTEYLNYTLSGYGGFEPGAGSLGEGSGHYDGLGWGSLLYHMDAEDVVAYLGNKTTTASAFVAPNVTDPASSGVLSVASSTSSAGAAAQTSWSGHGHHQKGWHGRGDIEWSRG